MQNNVLDKFTAPPKVVLEFLATFSRLEYALKVTKFRQEGTELSEVKADWKRFTAEISTLFSPEKCNELQEAFTYLYNYPLKFYGNKNGSLEFLIYDTSKATSDIENVILKIKQIRHNLFHGGKFAPNNSGDQNNDFLLLNHSITTLLAIKDLIPEVNDAYNY